MIFKPDPRSVKCHLCGTHAGDAEDVILFNAEGQRLVRDPIFPIADQVGLAHGLAACPMCRREHGKKTWPELLELATVHAVAKALES